MTTSSVFIISAFTIPKADLLLSLIMIILASAFEFPKEYSLFVCDHDDEDGRDAAQNDDDGEGE